MRMAHADYGPICATPPSCFAVVLVVLGSQPVEPSAAFPAGRKRRLDAAVAAVGGEALAFRILWGNTRGGSSPPFRTSSRRVSRGYQGKGATSENGCSGNFFGLSIGPRGTPPTWPTRSSASRSSAARRQGDRASKLLDRLARGVELCPADTISPDSSNQEVRECAENSEKR